MLSRLIRSNTSLKAFRSVKPIAPSFTVINKPTLNPRTMATKDSPSAGKGGITSWASGKDGSFKRQESSFRDVIEKGGKFEPEKGK